MEGVNSNKPTMDWMKRNPWYGAKGYGRRTAAFKMFDRLASLDSPDEVGLPEHYDRIDALAARFPDLLAHCAERDRPLPKAD